MHGVRHMCQEGPAKSEEIRKGTLFQILEETTAATLRAVEALMHFDGSKLHHHNCHLPTRQTSCSVIAGKIGIAGRDWYILELRIEKDGQHLLSAGHHIVPYVPP